MPYLAPALFTPALLDTPPSCKDPGGFPQGFFQTYSTLRVLVPSRLEISQIEFQKRTRITRPNARPPCSSAVAVWSLVHLHEVDCTVETTGHIEHVHGEREFLRQVSFERAKSASFPFAIWPGSSFKLAFEWQVLQTGDPVLGGTWDQLWEFEMHHCALQRAMYPWQFRLQVDGRESLFFSLKIL